MNNQKPLVSIIIINWNGGKVLDNCLRSIKKSNYSNYELIVVDNGSSDGSQKYAQIKNNKNLGFAPANNQGLKLAKGKYILILNNDTRVTESFLSKMVLKMENTSDIGVIQPKIYMMDKKGYLDNAGSFFTKIGFLEHWGFGKKDSKEFDKETEIFSAKGACMLIRKSIIDKIGLFDSDFVSYFEESDFCWRVWLLGYKVIFYPKATIYHKVGFTIRRLDVGNINYHYYKNRISSLIKNLNLLNLLIILPVHLVISLGISILFLLRCNVKNSILIIQAVYWNLINLPKLLRKRNKIQDIRIASDRQIFRKLSKPVDFRKFFADFKRVERDIKQGEAPEQGQ